MIFNRGKTKQKRKMKKTKQKAEHFYQKVTRNGLLLIDRNRKDYVYYVERKQWIKCVMDNKYMDFMQYTL